MAEGWAAWLKVVDAAKFSDVKSRTVRGWLKSGLRHSRLPSGLILIKTSDLDSFLEGHRVGDNEVQATVDQIVADLRGPG
jgi:hypothetical protein